MDKFKPDSYQEKAIKTAAKDSLVLAGAGSGKTSTILARIRHVIEHDGADPGGILVLTFTRVAANNMREKYLADPGVDASKMPEFSTFHAFCHKIMQSQPEVLSALGYRSAPSIVDEVGMGRYISRAIEISSCGLSKSKLKDPDSLGRRDRLKYDDYMRALKRLMSRDNAVDFDTLCSSVCGLFKADDPSISSIKSRYKYVFVDEFQDTDAIQYDFVMSFADSRRMLCGDALQNIYQFRGCTNAPMKDLIRSDHWVKYELPMNYRSTVQICGYVNDLDLGHDDGGYRVMLKSNRSGVDVVDIRCANMDAELVGMVCDLDKDGGGTAVLCRTNMEADHVTEILRGLGLDVTNNGDADYLVNLLRSIDDPEFLASWASSKLSDAEYAAYVDGGCDPSGLRAGGTASLFDDFDSVKSILDDASIPMATKAYQLCSAFSVDPPSEGAVECNGELVSHVMNRVMNRCGGSIYVGTVHSAKGLEYRNVIVYGVDGGHFKIDSEENGNILYVACTRAMDRLAVLRARGGAA